MDSTFGKNIIVSLFGESRQREIGITVHGLPAGIPIDDDLISAELKRRRPSHDFESERRESDEYRIICGVKNGFTTGAPFTAIIVNKEIKEKPNDDAPRTGECLLRPSHADYPAYVRFRGFSDCRGGGHFSGRLTAPLVLIGAVIKTALSKKGITIASETIAIGGCRDKNARNAMLEDAKRNGDTLGGIIKVTVGHLPVGIGEPFFNGVESVLSHLLFAIPSVKGVSFGDFDISSRKGSEVKEELRVENGKVTVTENHCGGVAGGLTDGNDLIVFIAFKPVPATKQKLHTVDIVTKTNREIVFEGRSDICICFRAGVIAESVIAIGLADLLVSCYGSEWLS